MVGLSVHGLLGIDAELQQSAVAARQQQSVGYHSLRVVRDHHECDSAPAENYRL
jgi:chitinase